MTKSLLLSVPGKRRPGLFFSLLLLLLLLVLVSLSTWNLGLLSTRRREQEAYEDATGGGGGGEVNGDAEQQKQEEEEDQGLAELEKEQQQDAGQRRQQLPPSPATSADADADPQKFSSDSDEAHQDFLDFHENMRNLKEESRSLLPHSTTAPPPSPPQNANSRLRLTDLCVFGTFNSACSGRYVSMATVNSLLLTENVRYLDFEVFPEKFNSVDYIPVIGCSVGSANNHVNSMSNSMLFSDFCFSLRKLLSRLRTPAMGEGVGGGGGTVVFLQLRIRTKPGGADDGTSSYFARIAKSITASLDDFLIAGKLYYADESNLRSKLGNSKKIVIIADRSACPELQSRTTAAVPQSFDDIVNLYTNIQPERLAGHITFAKNQAAGSGGYGDSLNCIYPSYNQSPSLLSFFYTTTTTSAIQPDVTQAFLSKRYSGVVIPLVDYSQFRNDTSADQQTKCAQLAMFARKAYLSKDEAAETSLLIRSSYN